MRRCWCGRGGRCLLGEEGWPEIGDTTASPLGDSDRWPRPQANAGLPPPPEAGLGDRAASHSPEASPQQVPSRRPPTWPRRDFNSSPVDGGPPESLPQAAAAPDGLLTSIPRGRRRPFPARRFRSNQSNRRAPFAHSAGN